MPSLESVRDGVADESLRFAILSGLATVPFTLLFSWGPVTDDVVVIGENVSGMPLLLAGLLVGYYYADRSTECRRAGIWTGLAGSVGLVLVFLADTILGLRSAPTEMLVIVAVFLPVGAVLGVAFTVLVTTVAAMVAGWVRTRLDPDRRVADESRSDEPNAVSAAWRRFVLAYALVAPLAVASMWIAPTSGAAFALSFLVLFVTVPLAILALIGIFVDATAPRAADADWVPNAVAYAGLPIAAYALVYAAAAFRGSPIPSAPGMYGFIVALWVTTVAYLASRRRAIGTTPRLG